MTLYVAVVNVDTVKIDMWACADGSTWEVKDSANAPSWNNDSYNPSLWCLERGDLIYVVHLQSNNYTVTTFDKSTETWGGSAQGPAYDASAHEHRYSQSIWQERMPCCMDDNWLWIFFPQYVWSGSYLVTQTAYCRFGLESATWETAAWPFPPDLVITTIPLCQEYNEETQALPTTDDPVAAWVGTDGRIKVLQIVEAMGDEPVTYTVLNSPCYVLRDYTETVDPPTAWAQQIVLEHWYQGTLGEDDSYGIRTGVGCWDGSKFYLPHWAGAEGFPNGNAAVLSLLDSPLAYSDTLLDDGFAWPPAPGIGSGTWTFEGSQCVHLASSGTVAVMYSTATEDLLISGGVGLEQYQTNRVRACEVSLSAGVWMFWLGHRVPFQLVTSKPNRIYACKAVFGETAQLVVDVGDDTIHDLSIGLGPGNLSGSSLIYPAADSTVTFPLNWAHTYGPDFCYGGLYDHGGPSGEEFRNVWDGMVATHPGNCFAD